MVWTPKNDYVPISVAYRKKYGKKVYVKTFTNLPCPDKLITNKSTRLPEGCEILEIGWGKRYESRYLAKYK